MRYARPADRGKDHGADVLVTLVVAVVLGVAVPVLLSPPRAQVAVFTLVLHYAVVGYAALRIASLVGRGEPRWFDLTFWSFGYVWMGIAGFAQRMSGRNPYDLALAPSRVQGASLLTLAGFVAYDLGRHRWGPRLLRRPAHGSQRVLDLPRVRVFAGLAVLVTPVIILLLGGLDVLVSSRYERSKLLEASGLLTGSSKYRGGILVAASYALPLVASLGLIAALRLRPVLRRRPAWTVGVVLLLGTTLLVGNPVSASRYWVGTIVLGVVFVLTDARSQRSFRVVALAILGGLVVVFPYADRFRYAGYVESRGRGLTDLMVNKADYDASLQLVNVIGYVSDNGLTAGRQLLGAVLFFVPRQLWSDKPVATGTLLSEHAGLLQVNVSSPLWAEAYVDGGPLLLVVVFVLLGILACWLQQPADRPESWRPVLGAVVAAYSVILLRGSLMSNMGGLVLLVLFLRLLTVRRLPKAEGAAGRAAETAVELQPPHPGRRLAPLGGVLRVSRPGWPPGQHPRRANLGRRAPRRHLDWAP